MTIYMWAQLIGLAGYLLYTMSPYFHARRDIVKAEAVGCALLAMQWYLLSQPSIIVSNALIAMAGFLNLAQISKRKKTALLIGIYTAGLLLFSQYWSNSPIDYLALLGLSLMIYAKNCDNIYRMHCLSAVSGAIMLVIGLLALSVPAAIFNFVFMAGHIRKIISPKHAIIYS